MNTGQGCGEEKQVGRGREIFPRVESRFTKILKLGGCRILSFHLTIFFSIKRSILAGKKRKF
jgi:hypothetical protein